MKIEINELFKDFIMLGYRLYVLDNCIHLAVGDLELYKSPVVYNMCDLESYSIQAIKIMYEYMAADDCELVASRLAEYDGYTVE